MRAHSQRDSQWTEFELLDCGGAVQAGDLVGVGQRLVDVDRKIKCDRPLPSCGWILSRREKKGGLRYNNRPSGSRPCRFRSVFPEVFARVPKKRAVNFGQFVFKFDTSNTPSAVYSIFSILPRLNSRGAFGR